MGTLRPRIGIVTPSYNQGNFIRETIEGVLQQEHADFEYWVIDGGSTDDTREILRSFGSRVKWLSEKDEGQAQAINKGLKRITADVVAFINSDDVYLPGTFSLVADYFRDHPEAVWVTGDHFIIDGEGKRMQPYVTWYKRAMRRRPGFTSLAIANFIIQPSTFWRRELLEEIGFFDETLRYCFDYEFWMRAIVKHPVHVIEAPLSLFRIHRGSKGGSEYAGQFAEEHRVLRRYTDSPALLALHKLHAGLIVFAYRFIKR